jgi:hypothetical protein
MKKSLTVEQAKALLELTYAQQKANALLREEVERLCGKSESSRFMISLHNINREIQTVQNEIRCFCL